MSHIDSVKRKEYQRQYRKTHAAQFTEYRRKWRDANRDEIRSKAVKRRALLKDEINEYARAWYKDHLDEQRLRGRIYRMKHPEKARTRKLLWRANNAARYKQYGRDYMKNNQNARLSNSLRARVICALKSQGAGKKYKTEELLSCTLPELKRHLETLFLEGMSWDNWGLISSERKTWNIDHIKPCCEFDLSRPEEQKKCFNYKNLQPLWAFDNLSKGRYATSPASTEHCFI